MSSSKPDEGARAAATRIEPDAHGQAALLLSESMLHMLVERRVLTAQEAVAVVRTAAEVKAEVAAEAGESKGRMQASLDLLERIASSFATDGDGKGDTWPRPA